MVGGKITPLVGCSLRMHYGSEVFTPGKETILRKGYQQYYTFQSTVPEKASWSIIASSFFNNDWNWGAEKAIDGIELPENAFVSAGAAPALQWLQIDFGITVKVLTGTFYYDSEVHNKCFYIIITYWVHACLHHI